MVELGFIGKGYTTNGFRTHVIHCSCDSGRILPSFSRTFDVVSFPSAICASLEGVAPLFRTLEYSDFWDLFVHHIYMNSDLCGSFHFFPLLIAFVIASEVLLFDNSVPARRPFIISGFQWSP